MGHTITLELPEEVYEALQTQAASRKMKPDRLALEWLIEIIRQAQATVEDPLVALIGSLECEATDIAKRHNDYIGRALQEEEK